MNERRNTGHIGQRERHLQKPENVKPVWSANSGSLICQAGTRDAWLEIRPELKAKGGFKDFYAKKFENCRSQQQL